MTKDDLVKEVSQRTGIERNAVINTIEALMETIRDTLSKNKNVYLRGFGTFQVKKRARKTARNITKNTVVIVPEHYIPAFKPSKEWLEKVKAKKA
jgi:DNA-binding protein HU-beta